MQNRASTRATLSVAFVLVGVALVSYLAGQGALRKRAFIVDSTVSFNTTQFAIGGLTNESMVTYVEQRLQEHLTTVRSTVQVTNNPDFKAIEDYLFRPFSKLNNELDQKSIQNAIHSSQLSNDLTLNKAILYNLPDTIDEWLSAVRPDFDWRNAGWPAKTGYPEIKDVPKCEQWIDDVLSQRTDMQKADVVEPQTLPDSVCRFFRRLQGSKVCRPAGSRSWIFHALGKTDMDMVRGFMGQFKALLSQHNIDGMVYFSFMEMLVDRNPTHWHFPERTWIVDATIASARSFKHVYGVWPLIVVNTEREKVVLDQAGVPSYLDSTLIWRGAQVAGYRWLSRTTIVKYIYAYLILEAGYTAVFFDSDSFWARKLIVPHDGSQYDFIINEEGHTRAPEGKYYRKDPMTEPKAHGYRPLTQDHGWLKGLRQTTCSGFSDTVLYNSGIWVAYPTEWSMRFLSTFVDLQLVTWSFWWEQNMFQHLLPIYAAWGLRLAVFGPGVSAWGEPVFNSPEACNAGNRHMMAWIHTKAAATSWPVCSKPGVYTWKAPAGFMDAKDANITTAIIADSQR